MISRAVFSRGAAVVSRSFRGVVGSKSASPSLRPAIHALTPNTDRADERSRHVCSVSTTVAPVVARDEVINGHPDNNVTDTIYERMGRNLHLTPNHPLNIIRTAIYDYFDKSFPGRFNKFDQLPSVVSVEANFDEVLVPADHVSRSPNDTYYVDDKRVLRCHTSAHQAEMLRNGESAFLVTGDVYRRDSIDATHYPVFHQMEGVCVFTKEEWEAAGYEDGTKLCEDELKRTLEGLARHLFGDVEMRWVDAYFPFTEPSFELEIFFGGDWLEVLGCGVMQKQILDDNGRPSDVHRAWAFGLGLERLAMVLFDIPDIRLFWSADERFTTQFRDGDMSTKFKAFSKFPPCYKDVAFWISDKFTENNLCEVVRSQGGDLVEEVKKIDDFTHPKTGRTSHCYRVTYRSMERSLTDDEINAIQNSVRDRITDELGVELR